MTQKEKARAWDELIRQAEINSKKTDPLDVSSAVAGKMILVSVRGLEQLTERHREWVKSMTVK